MSRWISLLVLVLVLTISGAWLAWYLAYEVNDERPQRTTLAGLSGPVEINWHDEDFPIVKASSELDAYAALGYVQGIERAWTMLLLRQTALGRQAEWFGDNLLELDRFTRQLELAHLAQEAYDSLSTDDQALLAAYTNGVNAALQSRYVRLSDELAMLDLDPEPWEPWHALAIERLYAWLATTPPADDTLSLAGPAVQAFFKSDALLRDWLHLHGFGNSIAWAYADSSAAHIFQRQVYGSSALPFFAEIVLQWPGQSLMGGSIPGTPFFLAGKTEEHAWALLPRGTARLVHTLEDTTRTALRYERLHSIDGSERLIALNRQGNTIYFPRPPEPRRPDSLAVAPDSVQSDSLGAATTLGQSGTPADTTSYRPDSTWALTWTGFSTVSDWPAWRAVHTREPAAFRLLDTSGLTLTQDGSWQVIGAPLVVVPLTRGVLVGNTDWSRYVALDLDSLLAAGDEATTAASITIDYHSEWAAGLAPALVASMDSIPERTELMNEALTYLRNWDYAYDRASIAASIFDTWISLYRDQTGRLPTAQIADTLYFENLIRYQTLGQALSRLRSRFGADMSQWRWENAYPDRRLFPVWSADSLLSRSVGYFAESRFAPIDLPGRGHPTTVFWGPSPVQGQRLSQSTWTAWTSTDTWDSFFVRRYRLDLRSPLGRYRTSDRIPTPVPLSISAEPVHTTILSPPAR